MTARKPREPRLLRYAVQICEPCIRLMGQQCHTPECVFCWRDLAEVEDALSLLLIRPKVAGEHVFTADEAVGMVIGRRREKAKNNAGGR